MNHINVSFIKLETGESVENLHSALDQQPRNILAFHPWNRGDKEIAVASFAIAHNNRSVLLKFFVVEKELRAVITKTNGPVWEDSCVEFFVSFDPTGYYNFEFNTIGTLLGAFGKSRLERAFLPVEMLNQIRTHTRSERKARRYFWEMIVVIPIELFICHPIASLSGVSCRGNFYKCGDGLKEPHYLSWSNILSAQPDFHLPGFFGVITFQ
jgi:hypothetical protein